MAPPINRHSWSTVTIINNSTRWPWTSACLNWPSKVLASSTALLEVTSLSTTSYLAFFHRVLLQTPTIPISTPWVKMLQICRIHRSIFKRAWTFTKKKGIIFTMLSKIRKSQVIQGRLAKLETTHIWNIRFLGKKSKIMSMALIREIKSWVTCN